MKTTAFSLLLCLSFWSYQPKAISVGNPIIFEEDTDTCLTPDRKTGLCIDFEDCGSLKKLLECSSREVLDYLRISVCGFSLGFNSKVCCPQETPLVYSERKCDNKTDTSVEDKTELPVDTLNVQIQNQTLVEEIEPEKEVESSANISSENHTEISVETLNTEPTVGTSNVQAEHHIVVEKVEPSEEMEPSLGISSENHTEVSMETLNTESPADISKIRVEHHIVLEKIDE